MSNVILGYHVNDITYNPNSDKLYIATMDNTSQILIVDPVTLEIESEQNVGLYVTCIAYDEDNDLYYIKGSSKLNIYDSQFNLLKSNSISVVDIENAYGIDSSSLRGQSSIVLDSNFIEVYNILGHNKCMETLLIQRGSNGGYLKQIYGFPPYTNYDEIETIVKIKEKLYVLGLVPMYGGTSCPIITVDQLLFSEYLSLQQQPLLLNDGNLKYTTDFLTIVSSRCKIESGGYVQIGNMISVHLVIKILASLSGPNFWSLIRGFPSPSSSASLSIVGISNGEGTGYRGQQCGAELEYGSSGILYIKNNVQIDANEVFAIDGIYLRKIYD